MPLLLLVLLVALTATGAQASPASIHVVDRNGNPVRDAVVATGPQVPLDQEREVSLKAIMDQLDKRFVPYVLPIAAGTSVEFPNSDQIRHHVYSFSPAGPFEIKLYHGTPGAPISFAQPGIVVLGCNIHDNMVGYLYVTDRPVFGVTDADGMATLSDQPGDTMIVWHPALAFDAQKTVTLETDAVEKRGDTFVVHLDMEAPVDDPQAVNPGRRDRFRRFSVD